MKKINDICQWISIIGFLMVISSIPYGWSAYQRIACIVMLTGYILYLIFNQQWKVWKWTPSKWVYVVMIALWAMIPLRQLFDTTPPTAYYWSQLSCHHWFLFVGVVGLLGATDKIRLWHVALTMLATSLFMLAHCGYMYFGTTEFEGIEPLMRMKLLREAHINSHMVMDLYVNIALILGFAVYRSMPCIWHKILLALAMSLSWLVIWTSDGRIGVFSSLIVISVGVTYLLYVRNKYIGVSIAAILALLSVTAMLQRPRMTHDEVAADPRFVVWDYSVRMAKEKPICGYGLSSLSEQYVENAYTDSAMYAGYVEKIILPIDVFAVQGKTMMTHHPHNAFLMYWLAVGIIGVILLCMLFVTGAMIPVGDNRLFLWLFLLALFLQATTEPIGPHFHPQFIAMMLFAWELCGRHIDRASTCVVQQTYGDGHKE